MKENISSETIRPTSPLRVSMRAVVLNVPFLLVFWLSIALLLTITIHLSSLRRPFDYANSDVSATYSTMARSFVEHGVVALGGLPIRNNPPLGLEPDGHIHWPPLFSIVLSVVFRIFGECESVAHGLMLVILLANALAIYELVKTCCGSQEGLFSVFAWLVMPVTVKFGSLVLALQMSILFMLLAVLGFIKATLTEHLHRYWAAFGVAALTVAVLASWEPLLICPGLLAAALSQRRRSRIRLALLYSGVSALAFIVVITLYVFKAPYLASDLWHTVLFRSGLAPFESQFRIHTLVHETMYAIGQQPSPVRLLGVFTRRLGLELIGPLGTIAIGGVLIAWWTRRHCESDGLVVPLFGALMTPWLLWHVIMANQAYFNEFEMVLAAPMASAALGLGVMMLTNLAASPTADRPLALVHRVAMIILPVVMLLPLTWEVKKRLDEQGPESWMITYARDIQQSTELGAVVMVPYGSTEPLYYSKRHMIRGVVNDSIVDKVVERLDHAFPGSPVYLALRPDAPHQQFSQSLRRYRVAKQTVHLVLLVVSAASTSARNPR